MTEWIKCSDRLPKMNITVIVCYYGSDLIIQQDGETLPDAMRRITKRATVTLGWHGEDGWYRANGFPLMISPFYWCELPEAPECPKELIEQAAVQGEKLADYFKDPKLAEDKIAEARKKPHNGKGVIIGLVGAERTRSEAFDAIFNDSEGEE